MSKLHLISVQNGYFLRASLNAISVLHDVTELEKFIKNQLPNTTNIGIEMPGFNVSNTICKFKWGEYSVNVGLQRVDFMYVSEYAPDNKNNYTTIIGTMRSFMSALFSYLNNKYGVNRLGMVGNYMLTELDKTPSEYINDVIINKELKKKSFTVTSIEGFDVLSWENFKVNDVKRVWNANYQVTGKQPIVNLGIYRDINIPVTANKLSDELYNKFVTLAEEKLRDDVIIKMVE